MNVYNEKDRMTREQFLFKTKGLCPSSFGLTKFHPTNNECNRFEDCPECRAYAIKDIQFKGEEDEIIEESKYYKWEFNLEEFRKGNIAIRCKTEEEYNELIIKLKHYNFDLPKGSQMYNDETCYRFYDNGLYQATYKYYEAQKYTIYKFSEIDFSQVLCKEDVDNIALNKFNMTELKSITLDKLLSNRRFKTGDIVGDKDNIGIVYGDKVVYITAECTETINPKAYCEVIPVELIESKKYVQKALSQYLYEADYDLLERYFIKIKEKDTSTTKLYQVEFTYNSANLKNFISNDSEIKIGDIVECQCSLNSSNYQYCRVKNIIEQELTADEIKLYRICRKISL